MPRAWDTSNADDRETSASEPAQNDPDRWTATASDRWHASDRLALPRTPDRQVVMAGRSAYRLRSSEVEVLATVGAFRVVPVRELEARTLSVDGTRPGRADVRSLSDQKLVQAHTVIINHRAERVLRLTRTAQALLESSREDTAKNADDQQYYFGGGNARELAHDAQLYRLFTTEREGLEAECNRITRVVLDDELKAAYASGVQKRCEDGMGPEAARRDVAEAHGLPYEQGRLSVPDLRIEYETVDGTFGRRDLELATENYSLSQLAAKEKAGFRVYRAAGAGGRSRSGGMPADPHHLDWIR